MCIETKAMTLNAKPDRPSQSNGLYGIFTVPKGTYLMKLKYF